MGLVGFSISFGLFGVLAQAGLNGALGGTLLFTLLVASRVIGGMLSSATLPTAQAMMADLSSKEDRAASLGLIGAAFGLGVVFGPAIGAALSGISLTAPVFFSAALGLVTALVAWRTLPETRVSGANVAAKGSRRALLSQPTVLLLLAVSALSTLASVGMEQTIGFYVQDTLRLTPEGAARTVGIMLTLFGFVAALVQGGAIRPWRRNSHHAPGIGGPADHGRGHAARARRAGLLADHAGPGGRGHRQRHPEPQPQRGPEPLGG